MFRIAAFAQLAGTTAKTLRDYDRLNLFRPAWVDPSSGYRLYSAAQLPELRRVLALRDLGVGLRAIRALMAEGADLERVLEHRREALEKTRRDVDRRLAAVGITIASARAGQVHPDVVVRDIPPEWVAVLDVAAAAEGDIARAFYELESLVRDAHARAPRPPGALVYSSSGDRRHVEIFVPVRRTADLGVPTRQLPACRAATVIHRGGYDGLPPARRWLEDWVTSTGQRSSEPLRVLYLQFGAESELRVPPEYLARHAADFVTELQLPLI